MPEQYTKVRRLFDITGVLNTKLIKGSTARQQIFSTQYSDGRIEIDGNFFIDMGQTIIAGDVLIDLSDPSIFGTFTAGSTLFTITTLFANVLFGGAIYNAATKQILFQSSIEIVTLSDNVDFYIRGTIVPEEVIDLNLNFFGG